MTQLTPAQDELKKIILKLLKDGTMPPYKLTISDGQGKEVAFDVDVEVWATGRFMESGELDINYALQVRE